MRADTIPSNFLSCSIHIVSDYPEEYFESNSKQMSFEVLYSILTFRRSARFQSHLDHLESLNKKTWQYRCRSEALRSDERAVQRLQSGWMNIHIILMNG